MRILDGLARDIGHGMRALRRAPAANLLAVFSVALGIGANTAIFSLVNALMLRPLSGVRAPEELVRLEDTLPSTILDELGRDPAFAGACGASTPLLTTELHGDVRPIGVLAMTGGCTDTFGMTAELGRMLTPQDDSDASARVTVLTDAYWRDFFGGRADVLGTAIRVDGVPFTIVGVADRRFQGVLLGFRPGVLVPAAQDPSDAHVTGVHRSYSWVHVFARLTHGVSMEQARARLRILEPRLLEQSVPPDYRDAREQEFLSQKLSLVSAANGLDYSLRKRFSRPLTVLLGICFLVLLISCVNLANLLLARGVRRRREIAIRLAIGAPRALIVRQLAVESLLLVFAGSAAGLVLAYVADRVLVTQVQAALINFSLTASPDARVLAFAAAVTILTGVGFGILPAWRSSDVNAAEALKEANRGVVRSGGRTGRVLIAAQVALTTALVAGTGLFVSSLERLHDAPLGFRVEGVVEAQLFPLPNGYKNLAPEAYYRELLERVEALPGVESVGYSNFAPLFSSGYSQPVRFTANQETPGVKSEVFWTSDAFLRTMSIPLVAGQDFHRTDDARNVRTAMVSQTLARRLTPDGNVIGRHIRIGSEPEDQDLEIVGVAADARLSKARQADLATVYVNLWQYSYSAKYGVLLVRTRDLSTGFIAELRRAVRGAGHEYVEYSRTLEQQRENSLLEERLLAWTSSVFGVLALTLAAAGLYGLLAYHVASRTGEIGIRMALGATRGSVRWLVLGEALRLVAAGSAAGLLLTFAASRFIQGLLYGIRAFQPAPVLTAVMILLAVASLAAWAPAERACAVEPLDALRHE